MGGDVGGVLEPSGCETLMAQTFPANTAVGLLSCKRSTLQGMLGGGGGGETLRAMVSEATIGANKLVVVGRGGHEAERPAVGSVFAACFDDTVFRQAPSIADGVRNLVVWLAVVECVSIDGALRVPAPFDGMHSVGILKCAVCIVAAEAITVGGRVPGEDIDFEGDDGVLADLGGVVDGQDVEAHAQGLIVTSWHNSRYGSWGQGWGWEQRFC